MKKCPYCAEEIQDEAVVCRFCGRDLTPKPQPALPEVKKGSNATLYLIIIIMGLAVCIWIVSMYN